MGDRPRELPGEAAFRRREPPGGRVVTRLLVTALIAASIVIGAPSGPAVARPSRCHGADQAPTSSTIPQTREAMLCLINSLRRRHDAPALRASGVLGRAASQYTRQMVRGSFFGHVSPSGGTLAERLRATGYIRRDSSWAVGENLAWGLDQHAAPASIVGDWERSPGHRANLLARDYREAGVGVSLTTPSGAAGATYTIDFGTRS